MRSFMSCIAAYCEDSAMQKCSLDRNLMRSIARLLKCTMLLGMFILLTKPATAQTNVSAYWLDGNGSWGDPGSWSTATVPNNSSAFLYNVSIDPSTNSTVGLSGIDSGSAIVSTLNLGTQAALNVFPGRLDVLGTLRNKGSVTVGGSSLSAGVLDNCGSLFLGQATVTAGELRNNGSTTVADAQLIVNGNIVNSGSVNINASIMSATGNLTNTGSISGSGAIPSSVSVGGNLNNSGSLSVSQNFSWNVGGSMHNSGSLEMLGSVNAASFSQSASGNLLEQFMSGSVFGVLDVAGSLNLAGTLDFGLLGGYMVSLGDTFIIANFAPGQLTGGFSALLHNSFNNGLEMFDIDYDNAGGHLLLSVVSPPPTPTPEPGTWALFIVGIPVALIAKRRYGVSQ